MYAIFENGSKQYKVAEGDLVKVEKLDAAIGATVTFPVVLTADEKGIKVGKEVAKTVVTCEVVAQGKEKKIIVFKYKAKKNERKKQGHRQPFTQVKVTAIGEAAQSKTVAPKSESAAKKPAAEKAAAPKAATSATATKKTATASTATKKAATSTATKKAAKAE